MAPPTGGIAGEEGGNNDSTDERQQQSNDNTTDADGSLNSHGNAGNNSNLLNSSTSNNRGLNVGNAQPSSSSRRDRDTLARISSWAPIGSAREQRAAAAEARQRIASASATTRNDDDDNSNNNGGGNNNPPRSNRNIAVQGPPPLPRAIREFAARNNNTANATNNNTNGGITRLPFDPDEVIDDIPPLSMRDDSSSSSNDTSSMQDLIRRERVAEIRRRRRRMENEVIEIIDSSSDEEYSDVPELVDVGEDEIPPARSASANPYATVTLSNSRAGTATTGRDRTTATATTGTSTTGGPGGGTGSEDRMPGLRRIMNRLMFQTLSARGILPPGITSEEDMLDENGETRDPVDLLSMFDDAFMDVNPTTDVRKPDQLVCPTCMRVHLPVEGSERIAIPKEEGAETDDDYHTADHGDDGSEDYSGSEESSVLPPLYSDTESVDNDESLDSLPPLVPQNRSELDDNHDSSLNASNLTIPGDRVLSPTNGVGNLNASNLTARAVIHDAPPQDRPVNVDEIFPGFEREMESLSHEITSQLYEMAQQSRVTTTAGDDDVLSRNNESSEGSSMPSLETVDQGDNREGTANTATAANNNNNENEAGQDPSGENRDADTVPLNLPGNPMNSNNEEGPPSNLEVPSGDGQDDDEVLSQMSDMPPLEDVPEEPPANNNNNETATRNDNIDVAGENEENSVGGSSTSSPLPPLISRSRSGSSSSSMPPLIQRDFSSSESSGSMPALVRSTAAMNRAERGARDQGGGGFSIRNRMFSGFMPPAPRSRSRNTADKKKTNPITHLRDYGALRVYATATCPICLDVHEPIVALPCGHCICVEDYKLLGGYLACDKEKLKKEAGIKR